MAVWRKLAWGVLVLGVGCSGSRQALKADAAAGTGGSGSVASLPASVSGPYVDEELGFEVIRPSEEWQLEATNERTPEGLSIPVVLRHPPSGAQVVVQVAPPVQVTPVQFAERLTEGLRQQPGFTTTDPVPLALSDSAVGFDFEVGDGVRGRVVVRDGRQGRVLLMLATWPAQSVASVIQNVDALIVGIRPLPELKAHPHKTTPQAFVP
ncbi:hypothetical protein [Myxococcus stipitatus]|uniref:hypothetical protein n=1 Tax=Myxococcus stipitatus TaxID=83455 RepID=UPI0030CD7C48